MSSRPGLTSRAEFTRRCRASSVLGPMPLVGVVDGAAHGDGIARVSGESEVDEAVLDLLRTEAL